MESRPMFHLVSLASYFDITISATTTLIYSLESRIMRAPATGSPADDRIEAAKLIGHFMCKTPTREYGQPHRDRAANEWAATYLLRLAELEQSSSLLVSRIMVLTGVGDRYALGA